MTEKNVSGVELTPTPSNLLALRSEIREQAAETITSLKVILGLFSKDGKPTLPLTRLKKDELRSVSLGTTAEERSAETGRTPYSIYSRRSRLMKDLGVASLEQAVWVGIASGDIPIDQRSKKEPAFEIGAKPRQVLILLTTGMKTKQIAEVMKEEASLVGDYFIEARDLLGGINRPNTIRRACEERVLKVASLQSSPDQSDLLKQVHESLADVQPIISGAVDLAQGYFADDIAQLSSTTG
jgi:hypothetical protein